MIEHQPVLIDSIIDFCNLNFDTNITVFDGTFGSGGYTVEFLKLGFRVKACDLDMNTITSFNTPEKNLKNLTLTNGNYSQEITNYPNNYFDLITLEGNLS